MSKARPIIMLPAKRADLYRRFRLICAERSVHVSETTASLIERFVAVAEREKLNKAIALLESADA